MNTKAFRSALLLGSLAAILPLWLTRSAWKNSLSAFASSDNAQYYNLMHVLGLAFWLLNAQAPNRAYTATRLLGVTIKHGNIDILTGLLMGGILVTNMYLVYTWHIVFTVATLAVALFNILVTAPKADLIYRWIFAALALAAFVLGYFTEFHFLVGEALAMAMIAMGMARQIWIYD